MSRGVALESHPGSSRTSYVETSRGRLQRNRSGPTRAPRAGNYSRFTRFTRSSAAIGSTGAHHRRAREARRWLRRSEPPLHPVDNSPRHFIPQRDTTQARRSIGQPTPRKRTCAYPQCARVIDPLHRVGSRGGNQARRARAGVNVGLEWGGGPRVCARSCLPLNTQYPIDDVTASSDLSPTKPGPGRAPRRPIVCFQRRPAQALWVRAPLAWVGVTSEGRAVRGSGPGCARLEGAAAVEGGTMLPWRRRARPAKCVIIPAHRARGTHPRPPRVLLPPSRFPAPTCWLRRTPRWRTCATRASHDAASGAL
ncbi:hypothetical protein EJ06DRAFT_59354 [Trichodelitschia bisporula]|uniref:Uncharacterized protein n=1 Tax=Trichodelitschia bisporula TaxID=703511 RepID=A0A6G1HUQ4_9PEZI|nr:hypothetical protein EJ06DRAFT_59354 [Trichodelitschia bisporula]